MRNAIENKNFRRLKWLNESVLSFEKDKKFKLKKYFPETIKEPLNHLFKEEQDNEGHIQLIKELATKFQVKLTNTNVESDTEDNNAKLDK